MSRSPSQIFYEFINSSLSFNQEICDHLLSAALLRAHVMLEGPPGTGKTSLAKALSVVLGNMGRIQMTPDLSPSDIIGWEVLSSSSNHETHFQKGPIFNDFLFVDEINRASPRTQSALLEAMEERQVTVGQESLPLSKDFFVIATQNPLDMDGTYHLPQSQWDRFAIKITINHPNSTQLENIISHHIQPCSQNEIKKPDLSMDEIKDAISQIKIDKEWLRVAGLLQQHFSTPKLQEELGTQALSPRAWIHWLRFASTLSVIRGHDHLSTSCLRELLIPVFAHRMNSDNPDNLKEEAEKTFDRIIGH